MLERTFSIIKPDATKRNITGKINKIIEWVKNYDSWGKKDYIKAGVVVVIFLAVVINIFS